MLSYVAVDVFVMCRKGENQVHRQGRHVVGSCCARFSRKQETRKDIWQRTMFSWNSEVWKPVSILIAVLYLKVEHWNHSNIDFGFLRILHSFVRGNETRERKGFFFSIFRETEIKIAGKQIGSRPSNLEFRFPQKTLVFWVHCGEYRYLPVPCH